MFSLPFFQSFKSYKTGKKDFTTATITMNLTQKIYKLSSTCKYSNKLK